MLYVHFMHLKVMVIMKFVIEFCGRAFQIFRYDSKLSNLFDSLAGPHSEKIMLDVFGSE